MREFSIQARGHLRIPNGDATSVVRHEAEAHPVVANVDVRMVSRLFREVSNAIDELHGRDKVGKLPFSRDFSVGDRPPLFTLAKTLDLLLT